MDLLPGDSEACTITVTADTDLATATVAWSLDGGTTWVNATWTAAATYDTKTLTWSRPSQVTLSRSPASAGTVVTRDVYPVLTRVTIGATVLIRPGTARIRLPDVTPPPRQPIPGRGVPGGLAGLDSAGDVVDATNRKAIVTTDARLSDARTPTVHAHAEADVTSLTADLATKAAKASNLADLANAATARTNLGLASAATMTPAQLAANPGLVTQQWYPAAYQAGAYFFCNSPGSSSTGTLGNQALRITPWVVTAAVTVARLFAEFTAAGEANSVFRLGVYADDGTGRPATLVLDAGTISTGTGNAGTVATGGVPGAYEITVNLALTPGLYWVGGVVQGAATTQPTMRTVNTASVIAPISPGTTLPGPGTGVVACAGTMTGALTNLTAPWTVSAAARIGFRTA